MPDTLGPDEPVEPIEPAKGKIQGGETAEIQVGILLKKMRGESLLQYGRRIKERGSTTQRREKVF